MKMRQSSLVSGLVLTVAVGMLMTTVSVTVTGQETTYTASRTPDGQPDLQGFWTNQTYVPLERREGVTKAFYTAEEVAEIEGRAAEREGSQTEPGTIPDVHYDFTQFGLDRSQSPFARNLRTSLIVDPPNGRLPAVTAAWSAGVTLTKSETKSIIVATAGCLSITPAYVCSPLNSRQRSRHIMEVRRSTEK